MTIENQVMENVNIEHSTSLALLYQSYLLKWFLIGYLLVIYFLVKDDIIIEGKRDIKCTVHTTKYNTFLFYNLLKKETV